PLPSSLEADFRRPKVCSCGHRRDLSAAFRSSPSNSPGQEVVSGPRATRGRPPDGALAQPLVVGKMHGFCAWVGAVNQDKCWEEFKNGL
ncbi:hypothetical protein LEMLEM_LOCUS14148, partial [Lemmus lemmus]